MTNRKEIIQKIEEHLNRNDLEGLKLWVEDQIIELYIVHYIAVGDFRSYQIDLKISDDDNYNKSIIDKLKITVEILKKYKNAREAFYQLYKRGLIEPKF